MILSAITLEVGMLTTIISVACSAVTGYVTQRVINVRHQLRIDAFETAATALKGDLDKLEERVRANELQGGILQNQNIEILKAIDKLGDKIDNLKA